MHKEWCNYLDDHFFRRVYRRNEFKRKLRNLNSYYQNKLFKPPLYQKKIVTMHAKYYYFKEKALKGERIRHSLTDSQSDSSIANSRSIDTNNILAGLGGRMGLPDKSFNLDAGQELSEIPILLADQVQSVRPAGLGAQKLENQFQNLKALFQKKKKSHFELEEPSVGCLKQGEHVQGVRPLPCKNELKSNLKIIKPTLKHDIFDTPKTANKNEATLMSFLSQLIMEKKKTEGKTNGEHETYQPRFLKDMKKGNSGSATREEQSRKQEDFWPLPPLTNGIHLHLGSERGPGIRYGSTALNFNIGLKPPVSNNSDKGSNPSSKVTPEASARANQLHLQTAQTNPPATIPVNFALSKRMSLESQKPTFVNKMRNFIKKNMQVEPTVEANSIRYQPEEKNNQVSPNCTIQSKFKIPATKQRQMQQESLRRVQSVQRFFSKEHATQELNNQENMEKRSCFKISRKGSDVKRISFSVPKFHQTYRTSYNADGFGRGTEQRVEKGSSFNFQTKPSWNTGAKNSLSRKMSNRNNTNSKRTVEAPKSEKCSSKLNLFERKYKGVSGESKQKCESRSLSREPVKKSGSLKATPISSSDRGSVNQGIKNWNANSHGHKFSLNHIKQKLQVANMKTENAAELSSRAPFPTGIHGSIFGKNPTPGSLHEPSKKRTPQAFQSKEEVKRRPLSRQK